MNPFTTLLIVVSLLASLIGPGYISRNISSVFQDKSRTVNAIEDATATPTSEWSYPPPGEIPTAEPTITATLSVSETVIPTIEPTQFIVTPTTVATEEPTPTPVSSPLSPFDGATPISLNISTTPRFIKPGHNFRLQWEIENLSEAGPISGWAIRIPIPSGITPEVVAPNYIDQNTLVVPVNNNFGVITWQTDETITTTFALSLYLLKDGDELESKDVRIVVNPPHVKAKEGGVVVGLEGRVKVTIPKDVLPTDVDLAISELDDFDRPSRRYAPQTAIRIEAFDEQGNAIHKFNGPITIAYQYDETLYPDNEIALVLQYFDEGAGSWVAVPSNVDTNENILFGYPDHLSVYNPDVQDWQQARMPSLSSFQVAQFTGAATYSYPINIPAAPAGFPKPDLALSYNSQVVDHGWATSQAGPVGMGWSLDLPYIYRDMHGTMSRTTDDTFNIVMNNVSGLLLKGSDGYYHLADNENFWRFSFHPATNPTLEDSSWWEVWDQTGNRYEFRHVAGASYCEWNSTVGETMHTIGWRWSLTRIYTPFSSSAGDSDRYFEFDYIKDDVSGIEGSCYGKPNIPPIPVSTISVLPNSIIYPTRNFRVRFDYVDRHSSQPRRLDTFRSWGYAGANTITYGAYLKNILIEYDTDGFGVGVATSIIRKYVFSYYNESTTVSNDVIYPGYLWDSGKYLYDEAIENGTPTISYYNWGRTLTLASVQETDYNPNDTVALTKTIALPPTTFTYGDGMHLSKADNGQGGSTSFTYEYFTANEGAWNDPNQIKDWNWQPDPDAVELNVLMIYEGNSFIMGKFAPGKVYQIHTKIREILRSSPPITYIYSINNGDGTPLISKSVANVTNGTIVDGEVTLSPKATRTAHIIFNCAANTTCVYDMAETQVRVLPTLYRVKTRTYTDAVQNPPRTFTYDYTGHLFNQPIDATKREENRYYPAYTQFLGHNIVKETAPDGTITETRYFQDESKKGQVEEVVVKTSTGVTLQKVTTTYLTDSPVQLDSAALPINGYGNPFIDTNHSYWPRTTQTIETTYGSSGALSKMTQYEYNSSLQGGTQYGNLTASTEFYWNESDKKYVPYRRAETTYYPGTSLAVYLVGLPGVSKTYGYTLVNDTYLPTKLISSALYYYDSNATAQTAPSVGKLTWTRTPTWVGGSGVLYAEQKLEYDRWGNIQKQITFDQERLESDPLGGGTSRVTESCYLKNTGTQAAPTCVADPTSVAAYPSWQKNALNQVMLFTYDQATGLITEEKDLNGYSTSYKLDAAGRLVYFVRPGDTVGSPTFQASYKNYSSATSPFSITATQKIDGTQTISVTKYYNGFGELIQSRTNRVKMEDSNCVTVDKICDSVVDYKSGYLPAFANSSQSVAAQWTSMPYPMSPGSTYASDISKQFWNKVETDAMGRNVLVARPDSTTSTVETQSYNIVQMSYEVVEGQTKNIFALLTTTKDAKGNQTQVYTDGFGRVVRVDRPLGLTVTYHYDEVNRLLKAKTATGTTTITYDLGGRKVQMVDPDMGTWSYEYDTLGNLVKQTDARGCGTTLAYDVLNRLTSKTFSTSSTCPVTVPPTTIYSTTAITYKYDSYQAFSGYVPTSNNPIGRRTGMTDGTGQTIWEYDARGRTVQERKTVNDGQTNYGSYNTQWSYTANDQVAWILYPNQEKVSYGYLPQGTINSVSNYVTGTQYDAAGRVELRTLANGVNSDYSYYGWAVQGGRLNWALSGTSGAPYLQQLEYHYDSNGNIDWIKNYKTGINRDQLQTQSFGYDNLNRLISASSLTNGLVVSEQGDYALETYGYDGTTGNLTNKAGVTLNYANSSHKHAVSSTSNGKTYSYDQNGNLISRVESSKTYNFTYDLANQLVAISGGGISSSYRYDGDGNRVIAKVGNDTNIYIGNYFEVRINSTNIPLPPTQAPTQAGPACPRTGFNYCVRLPLAIHNDIPAPSMGEPPNYREWRSYYYAGNQMVAMRVQGGLRPDGGEALFMLTDHLGSTSLTIGTDFTTVSGELRYKAWGDTRYTTGTTDTNRRYTGQLTAEAGLYFYNARWYDPYITRFTQPDSIIPDPYNPLDYDRYSYARNNPIRFSDPSGHKPCESDYHDCDWRSEYLWKKAERSLKQWGGKDDLRAFTEIVRAGAKVYGNFDTLLPKLTEVFLGTSQVGPGALIAAASLNRTNGCGGVGREPRDCKGSTVYFSDTGFHSDFRDNHNQIYHVWGYIAETAAPGKPLLGIVGQVTGTGGNIVHEIGQSILGIDEGWGTSWQDYVLSEKGMQIGALITDQKITPDQLATVLYDSLSSGSNGRFQDLQSLFPPLMGSPR